MKALEREEGGSKNGVALTERWEPPLESERICRSLSIVKIFSTLHLFSFRSNCVINLVPDKQQVLQEAYRVLKVRRRVRKLSLNISES